MSTTAISAVVLRRPTTLAGWVVAAAAHVRPWVRLNVELCDDTGTITLRFMSRTEIPGMVPGCRLRIEGTPGMNDGSLIMLNSLYEFMAQNNVESL